MIKSLVITIALISQLSSCLTLRSSISRKHSTLYGITLNRTVQLGGLYHDIKRRISLGCPLSPLIGALYLKLIDDRMEKTGLFYVRFMDDWVILSPNRWKLKKAIQIVNQTLNKLKVEKHPDKSFIGQISKGFDFSGYSFEPKGLSIDPKTLANFLEHTVQFSLVTSFGVTGIFKLLNLKTFQE